MTTENLFSINPYSLDEYQKVDVFREVLLSELAFHFENNSMYRSFCEKKGFNPTNFNGKLSDIPAIAVSVFKELGFELYSVSKEDIKLTLQSSATSGIPSTVVLDKITSKRQAKAMVKVMQEFIGKERSPFLIADIKPKPDNLKLLGARYAAISGYLNFAKTSEYILDINGNNEFTFNENNIIEYLKELDSKVPIILFGFTYILYSSILKYCEENNITLPLPKDSKIIHIGGWKKLESEKISKEEFNDIAASIFKIKKEHVIDVYGFTEQMGLNYPDCECGYKHVPIYSEVIVRNPATGMPVADGEVGVLEFLTPLPHSYPGNVILTDDLGVIETGKCKVGRNGKRFKVLGRLKKSEIRGCGDILGNKMVDVRQFVRSQSKEKLRVVYHNQNLTNQYSSDAKTLNEIINHLNESNAWLNNQSVDNLIGLISEVAKKWAEGEGDLISMKDNGLGFLANWCAPEHLNRIASFGLRGDRFHLEGFMPFQGSKKQYLKANKRGLVCHWLAGNVQILGMFALVQSILTKNVNLLKISSRDDGAFLKLIKCFEGVTYTSKAGTELKGDDLLKTLSIVYFDHEQHDLGEIMSKNAKVRIAWGGREAVETVASYPKQYDTEDIIFGPKLSFSVVALELIDNERNAKKIARKIAVDASIFDQTGCASPHNLYIENGATITPEIFAELLANAMHKVSLQILKGEATPEQLASIHSIRGLYDFKGKVWGNEDLTWTVLFDQNTTLNQPVYSRVIMVHPVDHINDTLKFIDDNIQTIGVGAKGIKALDFASQATSLGVSRCPELGKMLNFESPWDGIVIIERLVRWSTLGGPII